MFTGIVQAVGEVKRARRRRGVLDLEVEAPPIAKELRLGDSVAVAGVCLTATSVGRRRFTVEAMQETLERTTLGTTERGTSVNLELAARLVDRLGGHLVQGHVDAVASVVRAEASEGMRRVWFEAPPEVMRYVVRKGSLTVDGVSLTVVDSGTTSFEVALIPHTLVVTTLGRLETGSQANVEVDVLAKYVERLIEGTRHASSAHR